MAVAIIVYVLLICFLIISYVKYFQLKFANVIASAVLLTWSIFVTLYFLRVEPLKAEKLGKEFDKLKEEKNLELFKLFYEQIGAEIRGRDNLTIIAGSIMVSASLILLGTLVSIRSNLGYEPEMGIILVASIMSMYSIWFICFNLTSRKLNRIDYAFLQKMEEIKEVKLHRLMLEKVRNKSWWNLGRRPVWLYFFYLLASICILLLLV